MHRFIVIIVIFSVLTGCLSQKSSTGFSIFERNDFEKSCLELMKSLESANKQKEKLLNQQKIGNAKNLAFYLAAIPTAFASLLFLKSDDDIEHDLFIINRRIVNLEDLLEINSCDNIFALN